MAAITHLRSVKYTAKMIGEDLELFEAIVCNDDNLSFDSIIPVQTGLEEALTVLTDYGVEELTDMLRDARISTKTWREFPDDFVNDAKLVARIKAQSLR